MLQYLQGQPREGRALYDPYAALWPVQRISIVIEKIKDLEANPEKRKAFVVAMVLGEEEEEDQIEVVEATKVGKKKKEGVSVEAVEAHVVVAFPFVASFSLDQQNQEDDHEPFVHEWYISCVLYNNYDKDCR